MTEIKEALLAFVADTGRVTSGPDVMSRPLRDLIDSIDMVQFLAFIEASFGIVIDDEDVTPQNFRDLESVAALVAVAIRAGGGTGAIDRSTDLEVERIDFETLKQYWLDVGHFQQPNKKIREVVRVLGPYECVLDDPRRESYGLFHDGALIGVTNLVQWDANWLRYRTINIRQPFRGPDLGWMLLRRAVDLDWRDWAVPGKFMFSWLRRSHMPWSLAHGFTEIDGRWHDDHIAMLKPMTEF
jgi:acyl carrier protein